MCECSCSCSTWKDLSSGSWKSSISNSCRCWSCKRINSVKSCSRSHMSDWSSKMGTSWGESWSSNMTYRCREMCDRSSYMCSHSRSMSECRSNCNTINNRWSMCIRTVSSNTWGYNIMIHNMSLDWSTNVSSSNWRSSKSCGILNWSWSRCCYMMSHRSLMCNMFRVAYWSSYLSRVAYWSSYLSRMAYRSSYLSRIAYRCSYLSRMCISSLNWSSSWEG
mmetsp:Transcript_15047/g.16774  ORF Transcript_15047/g.16774 Transcript_15047/m.16774 type:complete len:220 (-) Transcript_15047:139-798(-)